jgi:hypothetical protein
VSEPQFRQSHNAAPKIKSGQSGQSGHSLSYYWKDTRLTVYIWQPFEARII